MNDWGKMMVAGLARAEGTIKVKERLSRGEVKRRSTVGHEEKKRGARQTVRRRGLIGQGVRGRARCDLAATLHGRELERLSPLDVGRVLFRGRHKLTRISPQTTMYVCNAACAMDVPCAYLPAAATTKTSTTMRAR